MKKLKIILLVIVLFGALALANAQRKVVKVYPKNGTVVTTVYKPKVVIHNGTRFHFAKGVWYREQGEKYIVCSAPIGGVVKQLPRGYKVVRVNGRKLYKYKGIWYQKRRGGYIIVNI